MGMHPRYLQNNLRKRINSIEQQIRINEFWAKVAKDNNLPKDPKGFYTSTISWKTEKHWEEWMLEKSGLARFPYMKSPDYPKVSVPRLIILQVFDLTDSIEVQVHQFERALKYAGCREVVSEIVNGSIIS